MSAGNPELKQLTKAQCLDAVTYHSINAAVWAYWPIPSNPDYIHRKLVKCRRWLLKSLHTWKVQRNPKWPRPTLNDPDYDPGFAQKLTVTPEEQFLDGVRECVIPEYRGLPGDKLRRLGKY